MTSKQIGLVQDYQLKKRVLMVFLFQTLIDYTWSINAGQTINSISTVDSPGTRLDSDRTYHSVTDTFTMYLIYQPNGTDSIWVPIKQIFWSWVASAQRADITSNWSISTSNSTCQSSNQNSSTLPQWAKNIVEISWL
jgi:hypothetical protein